MTTTQETDDHLPESGPLTAEYRIRPIFLLLLVKVTPAAYFLGLIAQVVALVVVCCNYFLFHDPETPLFFLIVMVVFTAAWALVAICYIKAVRKITEKCRLYENGLTLVRRNGSETFILWDQMAELKKLPFIGKELSLSFVIRNMENTRKKKKIEINSLVFKDGKELCEKIEFRLGVATPGW